MSGACGLLGFERSVIRSVPTRPAADAPLRERLRALAAQDPRWGVPRWHWRLIREGLRVNYTRVERLSRLEGLAVRTRARKRLAVPRVPRPPVLAPNEAWGIDFVNDTLVGGRRFRVFTVVDLCTHECLATTVAHSLPSAAVMAALDSFNGRLRDECLNAHWFRTLADAQRVITRYRHTYNTDRPSRACWPLTPGEYARTFV